MFFQQALGSSIQSLNSLHWADNDGGVKEALSGGVEHFSTSAIAVLPNSDPT